MIEQITQYITVGLFCLGYITGFTWLFYQVNWFLRIFYAVISTSVWGFLTLIVITFSIATLRPYEEGITLGHVIVILLLSLLNIGYIFIRYTAHTEQKI